MVARTSKPLTISAAEGVPQSAKPSASAPNAFDRGDIRATVDAVLATGASRWEAVGMAASIYGGAATRFLWDSWSNGIVRFATIVAALDGVAAGSPETANVWLNAWLGGHEGKGTLDLSHKKWLTSLPDGLTVEALVLAESAIQCLPKGLRISENLILLDNPEWDGHIPEDAQVGMWVYTDRDQVGIPQSVTLEEWRAIHPRGLKG